jgi:hypothetical protein
MTVFIYLETKHAIPVKVDTAGVLLLDLELPIDPPPPLREF